MKTAGPLGARLLILPQIKCNTCTDTITHILRHFKALNFENQTPDLFRLCKDPQGPCVGCCTNTDAAFNDGAFQRWSSSL